MKSFKEFQKTNIDAVDIQRALANHGSYKGVAVGSALTKTAIFFGNNKIGTINIAKGKIRVNVKDKEHKEKIQNILKQSRLV